MSYPFNTGMSIIVEPGASALPGGFDLAGPGRRFATVHVHHETEPGSAAVARPMLNVVAKVGERVSPGTQLGNNVMSWIINSRVDQRSGPVDRVCGEIAAEHAAKLSSAISALLGLKSAEHVLKHQLVSGLLSALADEAFPRDQRSRLAGLLLRLPWICLRYKPGRTILELLRARALELASGGSNSVRGYALEAAVAADQLLDTSNPSQRFLFLGATRLGKDGQPEQEWDVLRLDLDSSQGWSLTAVECAVVRSGAKDEDSRTKLEFLRTCLAGRFSDITSYRTLLATVTAGKLQYEDAGRSWTKV